MIHEEIEYPEFYGELKQVVFAPATYISTSQYHTTGTSDHYSRQLYFAKIGYDKGWFFSPQICDLVTELIQKKVIEPISIIAIMPNHDETTHSPTLHKAAEELSKKFNVPVTNALIRTKKSSKSAGKIETLPERYSNIKDTLTAHEELSESCKTKEVRVLLLDDVKTTGLSIMEATKILLEVGVKKVYPVVFGINNHRE